MMAIRLESVAAKTRHKMIQVSGTTATSSASWMLPSPRPPSAPASRPSIATTRHARQQMAPWFPGDPQSGLPECSDEAEARFCERFEALPCPSLDPASSRCDLYGSRPVTCRTFGPSVRFGGEDMPHC